eukprot:Tbor_TRINITY_DN5217_c0_g1::TRINITY_DN5217_c0_g1_i2::g.16199::m.16199/K01867/WARS, trpS; tryptophanyl-tRNA synthetase
MDRDLCMRRRICSNRRLKSTLIIAEGTFESSYWGTSPFQIRNFSNDHNAVLNSNTSSNANPDDIDTQSVTPWSVTAKGPKGIDYSRVVHQFQSEIVDENVKKKFETILTKLREKHANSSNNEHSHLHHFLRRGIVFSHRGLGDIISDVEMGRRFYLYTGRGPSATSMHIGHVIPFMLTKYLQDALAYGTSPYTAVQTESSPPSYHVPLVVQLTDDEKFLFRGIPLDKLNEMTMSNIKDILAFGFCKEKTFVFRNTEYAGRMYKTTLEIQRHLTANAVKNTLGLLDSDNVGKYSFPAMQAAPSYVSAFPNVLPMKSNKMKCLIPCAIDQDPFFVLTRGISDRLKRPKPCLLHTTFLPSLKGATHKMSSSAEHNGVILLSDTDEMVHRKLKSAFSGGRGTLKELQEEGADLDSDVAYQILRFFDPSDEAVTCIGEQYKNGSITSAAVKERAADVLCKEVLGPWRARRAAISEQDVQDVMAERSILSPSPLFRET